MSRLIFVNLPVADVERSTAFFSELGFAFDAKFTTDSCACMVISEGASYAMLLQRDRFAEFTPKPVADGSTAEALVCLSAASRDEVDELSDAALASGATPANDPMDHGFMYGRSFNDPDGHQWEIMWMSPEAVEAGASDMAGSAA